MKSFEGYVADQLMNEKIEKWINENVESFKEIYIDTWEAAVYASAIEKFSSNINEDTAAPTNSTGGVANSDAKPLFKSKKVAGVVCVEVDSDTYMKCRFGKRKYSRWSGVVEDESLRDFVKKNYAKEKQMLVMNRSTGSATYIKR